MNAYLKKFFYFITSMRMALVLLVSFIIALAIGTYIENAYGYESAAALIYLAKWFEGIMLLLIFILIAHIVQFRFYRATKRHLFLLHISFIVFFIGATLTRFYGFEGSMTLKEGVIVDKVNSKVAYLSIEKVNTHESFFYPLYLNTLGNNHLQWIFPFASSRLHVTLEKVDFDAFPKSLSLSLMNEKQTQIVVLKGNGFNTKGIGQVINHGNEELFLEWGSKEILLPFQIRLKQLNVSKYPGSQSPSMIQASLDLFENGLVQEKNIAVNQPITHGKFIFFISAYDLDENGFRLLVNYDPGKKWIYTSYILFFLGMIATLLSPNSRVRELFRGISMKTIGILCLVAFSSDLRASPPLLNETFANTFSSIIVQGNDGRMKPLDTVNQMIFNKIVGTDELLKTNYNQVVLGMSFYPLQWQQTPMFALKHSSFQEILHVKEPYVCFLDFFDSDGNYLLREALDMALAKDEFQRGVYEKELIKLDERINIAYLVYTGKVLKLFPKINDKNHRWFDPNSAMDQLIDQRQIIGDLLTRNQIAMTQGLSNDDWSSAYRVVNDIKAYQYEISAAILPSALKIKVELFYNKWQLFEKLYPLYLLVGSIFLLFSISSLVFHRVQKNTFDRIFLNISKVLFFIHTCALLLRWYISGYAPWSNAYEGMLYIAWCMVGVGIFFSRYLILTVPITLLFSGICLFVAHLSWMEPMITPLVPSLQSHWLVIHVAVISASYGFLGLSCLLGIMILMLLMATYLKIYIKKQFSVFLKLNEISIIFGLFLLVLGTCLGSVWANETWGRYWGWDVKEVWSLITICLYGGLLHYKFSSRVFSSYLFTVLSICFYGAVIMTYFGVNYYLSGLHSYGMVKMVEFPKVLIYGLVLLFVLIGWTYPKRKELL